MYRFLLTPKWIASFLLCVLAALICVRLGIWQLHRLDEKRAINASITAARTAPPAPVDQELTTTGPPPQHDEYKQVKVVGRFDPSGEVLVRNRTQDATLGFYVLTPLRTVDGPTLWVARGWVAASSAGATHVPATPPAPTGTVSLVGRVRLPESGSTGAVTVDGRNLVSRITGSWLERDGAYRAFVELSSSTPTSSQGLTALPPPDDLDEGPHLAYFIQWNMFAVLFFVGYGLVARNTARRDESPDAPRPVATTA